MVESDTLARQYASLRILVLRPLDGGHSASKRALFSLTVSEVRREVGSVTLFHTFASRVDISVPVHKCSNCLGHWVGQMDDCTVLNADKILTMIT